MERISASEPEGLSREELSRLILDMFHRIMVHHTLWFREVEHQIGFERALEVHYLLDLGLFQPTDESGTPLGPSFRSIDIGAVVYVAGVGPVRSRERRFIAPTSGVLEGSPPALFDVEMNLIGTGTIARR